MILFYLIKSVLIYINRQTCRKAVDAKLKGLKPQCGKGSQLQKGHGLRVENSVVDELFFL